MATPPGEGKATSPMEQWLREQAEKAQANRVTTNRAMCIAPVLYFGTWRTTGSDVLSIVTTTTPFRRTAPSRKKWKHGKKITLKNPTSFKDPHYTSPLLQNGEADLYRGPTHLNSKFETNPHPCFTLAHD